MQQNQTVVPVATTAGNTAVGTPATEGADRNVQVQAAPKLQKFGAYLGEWERFAREAHHARVTGTPRGPLTGFRSLDSELGGALKPGIHFVHGQPGVGKTAFALQVGASCGCPALYVTCEMAPIVLLQRHTARVTDTFLGDIISGSLRPEDSLAKARTAVAAAPDLVIADATIEPASLEFIGRAAAATRQESRHLLIIIDSLHSWAERLGGDRSEYETLNASLVALRGLAHALSCPILAISERNRSSMEKGGLSSGAGTRKIEYSAESVIDLSMSQPAQATNREAEVKVKLEKNRHGAAGRAISLYFTPALQKYAEKGGDY